MSLQGDLEFRDANKITFIGGSSNTLIDLTTGSLGVGVTGTSLSSNLHVAGNKIKVGDNIFSTDGPHGRLPKTVPLKKYPEIEFEYGKLDANETTFTYTQAGYTVKGTNSNTGQTSGPGPGRTPWKAFSAIDDGGMWQPTGFSHDTGNNGSADNVTAAPVFGPDNTKGAWIRLELPKKIKLQSVYVKSVENNERVRIGKLYGSNNNSDWATIKDDYTLTYSGSDANDTVNSTIAYKYIVFQIRATGGGAQVDPRKIRYYGYEEDPPVGDTSIDTTFKSVLNTPQTTGANVYVDAKLSSGFTNQVTGPTPVGTNATHDNTNKYWEMNGQLTSNITVEANTFLEGDQPHAVSVWFNSSNLEANTANTCVFSISDQEKLDSVNLDLQSNTWHNLTYAYQGEGGSRVTYLDGRKVAEEQAEDTFGAYPPFDMTGYSQGGYMVSASSDYTSDSNNLRQAYELYYSGSSASSPENEGWMTEFGTFNPNAVNGDTFIDSDGGTHTGHFNKLKLPYKLKPSYFYYKHYGVFNSSRNANNWVILGSNNDSDWDLLHSSTTVLNATKSIPITATKGYTYLMFLCKSVNADTTLFMGEIRYYGHRENDLVRLPDPTNVLKYPHIKITNTTDADGLTYAIRGYEFSRSYDGETMANWYDENTSNFSTFGPGNYNGSASGASGATTGTYNGGTNLGGTVGGVSGQIPDGEWHKIKMPHKILLSKLNIVPRIGQSTSAPYEWRLYGSNDDSDWTLLYNKNDTSTIPDNASGADYSITTSTSTSFEYFAIVMIKSVNYAWLNVGEFNWYGTGVDSIPIQIGGGNIDKVANFRVYDKFIEEDQALEIWDAQKDEFGRAKSSMTLQKGRLGLGIEEPEGRLAVLDEPHNLEEFPPRAMTDYKTYFEGHGEFCVSASDEHSSNYDVQNAFNKITNRLNSSGGTTNTYYNSGEPTPRYYDVGNDYAYSGTSSTHGLGGVMGEWVKLEFPYKANISQISILPVDIQISTLAPEDFTIMGSSDDINWTTLRTVTGATWTAHKFNEYTLPSTTSYKYFALVVSRTVGANQLSIQELKYFGTREQGQSVLHDGQLTLTKNLNVPRIGAPLDADDTPRRDRLVVEYNTSTNPNFEGAVRDTSGRGFDGLYIGSDRYNEDLKSFTSFNTTNYIRTNISLFRGNVPHTHSVWFKLTSDNNDWNTVINLGQNGSGNGDQSAVTWDTSNNRLWLNTYNGGVYVGLGAVIDRWYHVVATHDGTGNPSNSTMKIYLDGVKQTTVDSGNNSGGTIDVTGDYLTIGAGRASNGNIQNVFNGAISNYKLYDIALTAEEAKTLYDMGRCDEGHHLVNFSKTRIGIGLGDGDIGDGAYGCPGASALTIRGNQEIKGGDIVLQGGDSAVIFNYHKNNKWKIQHGEGTGTSNQLHFKRYYHIGGGIHGWGDGGYLSWNGTGQLQNFTGQHKTFIKDVPFSQADDLCGLIVSSDQNKYIKMSDGIEAGSNAITMNESLPVVSLSNVTTDKKCFGVISSSEDPENRTEQYGAWGTRFEKEKGDTRVYINSVGEGAIWVLNTNGSLESGDYITTSNVAGYGQKQDDDVLHNYTVAKITMDCDFEPVTQPIQIIKKDEEGENVLDEHRQIQWEDHPTDTEKAYKIRYLDTSGVNTDEANAVHIAAFVGCTYHCG